MSCDLGDERISAKTCRPAMRAISAARTADVVRLKGLGAWDVSGDVSSLRLGHYQSFNKDCKLTVLTISTPQVLPGNAKRTLGKKDACLNLVSTNMIARVPAAP